MYRISELAEKVGLSRTALLYYEKQALIQGSRLPNGYRVYSNKDLQRVKLIQQLQAGGLTLQECKTCLEAKIDRTLLQSRLAALDKEIAHKQKSRQLLAAMLGETGMHSWHQSMDRVAPDAHMEWLIKQGFNEKEALRLRWLSKDMNEHESYMTDFMKVYETLDRWGPGGEAEVLQALEEMPDEPKQVLEIGSGKGLSTQVLVKHTQAEITAVDNEQSALTRLEALMAAKGFSDRIHCVCASMTEMPFENGAFDLIWAEGCAYIMGVENALKQWRPLLADNGYLMLSDLVWLSDAPDKECVEFWKQEYPDAQTVAKRLEQIKKAGYKVVSHFSISRQAWLNYIDPLKERVSELQSEMADSAALQDLSKELAIYDKYLGQFGYQMFVLQV